MSERLTPSDFAALLHAVYAAHDERLRREHHRSLSFQDAMFDRWERARQLGFSEGATITTALLCSGMFASECTPGLGQTRCLMGAAGR